MRAVQGKTDGEQKSEMERRWGLERRQSFWQVETIDKLISNVGKKVEENVRKCQQHLEDKFAKHCCAPPAHIRKVAFENWRHVGKKALKET